MWHPHQTLSHLYSHSLVASGSVSSPQVWEAPVQLMSPAERELLKCCKVSVCHSSCDLCPLLSCYPVLCPFWLLHGPGQDRTPTPPSPPLLDIWGHPARGPCLFTEMNCWFFFNALSTWNSWKKCFSYQSKSGWCLCKEDCFQIHLLMRESFTVLSLNLSLTHAHRGWFCDFRIGITWNLQCT